MAYFGYGIPWHAILEEDFEARDIAADAEFCRAIVAGKMGLHPDGWGNYDSLSTLPPRIRVWQREPYERLYHPSPIDLKAARHWPRPVVEEPKPRRQPTRPERRAMAAWHPHTPDWDAPAHGEIQLTCDVCKRHRLGMTLEYRGDRAAKVAEIRAIGRQNGWTCIAGTDRCPACSRVVEPNPIGNGAGGDQGNEQHA